MRTHLTAKTTFYVSTTGQDWAGDGLSPQTAWASLQGMSYNIYANYDLGDQTPVIQLIGSPHTAPMFYSGFDPVGGAGVMVRGDPANPRSFILDGGGVNAGKSGIYIAQTAGGTVIVDGITLQNFKFAINNQSSRGTIILNNVRFAGSNSLCIDAEGAGAVISYNGKISVAGRHDQLVYCGSQSLVDFNDATITFENNPSFNYVLFNSDSTGFISTYNRFSGAVQGRKFEITGGSVLNFHNPDGSYAPASAMPGTIAGTNRGGWFNNSFVGGSSV
jgi:hypothetical protein